MLGDDHTTVDALLARMDAGGEAGDALRRWLPAQRWYRAKSRPLVRVVVADVADVGEGRLVVLEAAYADGGPHERYVVLFALGRAGEGDALVRVGSASLVDGLAREEVARALLDGVARGASVATRAGGTLAFEALGMFHGLGGADGAVPAQVLAAEQSNTGVRFGDRWFLKVLRRLDQGTSADLEISRFLTERARFQHAPPLGGAIAYLPPAAREPQTVALLFAWIESDGEVWPRAVAAARAALHAAGPPDDDVAARGIRGELHHLGVRTAELHRALASDRVDPAFAPAPFDAAARRGFVEGARADLVATLARLEGHPAGAGVADLRDRAEARLEALVRGVDGGMRTRVHGDLHLGQILRSGGGDYLFLDFEGEPARTLAERRAKRSPLVDVAGVVRSIDYAARVALREEARVDPARAARAERRAERAGAAFVDAYLEAMADSGILPPRREDARAVLDAFVVDKCLYELRYELDNRPAWVDVPAAGLRALLAPSA